MIRECPHSTPRAEFDLRSVIVVACDRQKTLQASARITHSFCQHRDTSASAFHWLSVHQS